MALRAQELRRVCRLFWNKLLLSMCNTLKLSGLFVCLINFFSIWGTGKVSRFWFARGGGRGLVPRLTLCFCMAIIAWASLKPTTNKTKQNKKKHAIKKKPSASSLKHDWTKRFHKISKKTSVIFARHYVMFFLDFSKNGRGGGDIFSKKQLVEGCLAPKEWVYFQGVGIFHESSHNCFG